MIRLLTLALIVVAAVLAAIVVATVVLTARPRVSVGPPAIICVGTPTDFTCEEQK